MHPRRTRRHALQASTLAALMLLGACAVPPAGTGPSSVQIQRTTHGIAHIQAPHWEALAYGVAYAHAQDNFCQTAEHLVTVSGERSLYFGAEGRGALGLRTLSNEQIDFFIAAHMDDVALAGAHGGTSDEARALAQGYVAGYNRYLSDHATRLDASCASQPWLRPMTLRDWRRMNELSMVTSSSAALADAIVVAKPPAPTAQIEAPPSLAQAVAALDEVGLGQPAMGSNAWAFGGDSTVDGRGLLLGNPHFPWQGVNRFWQMHLSIPGHLDVMGAAIDHFPVVMIGFNRDIAWSHTVSTGKRFTLHQLQLVPGEPTRYLVDGKPEAMTRRALSISVRGADGRISQKQTTVWRSRFGPLVVLARAGLPWTATTAYAVQDGNTLNTRSADTWLGINRAHNVAEVRSALAKLGMPWVNTLAADRDGQALYADVSVVPDVDAQQLQRCAPGKAAASLFAAAGLVVLDGSRSDCDWRRDTSSPVPGLTPITRMPVLTRRDWVQNSNDSFVLSQPAHPWGEISPLVGTTAVNRPRTRAALTEIPELLAGGKVDAARVQGLLFRNRNFMGKLVVPELLAACGEAASASARDGCAVLAKWDGTSDLDARGAHLFREFWRRANTIPNVWRVPFDPKQPVATPTGLNLADVTVRGKVFAALDDAVAVIRKAGFALDARLAEVQLKQTVHGLTPVHGGDEFEGVLNKVQTLATGGLGGTGYAVDYGASYVQTVGFDAQGPVAHGLLTYGQSAAVGSPHAGDQLTAYARKQWPRLPFSADEVARERLGPPLVLTMPAAAR